MAAGEPPPLITECPNCHTRFRVGESQLQMAHGRVRCGACLAVFPGVDHLLLDDNTPAPELPDESNMLESVLAELADDDGDYDGPYTEAASAARAFELDALDARREDTREIAARAEAAGASESDPPPDWTSVSVDTREFARDSSREVTLESPAPSSGRVSIDDALDDEEALRWWLEDELPAAADSEDDGMVVQLSQLDAVTGDADVDLAELLGDSEDDSAARLEALFGELGDEGPGPNPGPDRTAPPAVVTRAVAEVAAAQASAAVDSPEVQELDIADTRGEQAAQELQDAIDEAEPLVARAMTNGTIEAAAERMAHQQRAAAAEQAEDLEEVAAESTDQAQALVEAPEETPASANVRNQVLEPTPARDVLTPAVVAASSAAAARSKAIATDGWAAEEFPETPAEMVSNITEEMAAAGRSEEAPQPSVSERVQGGIARFFGNIIALRIATAIAFLLLAGQILYWQFDDWSKTATLRPVYAGLCSVAGCELPVRRSLRDLQSRKLAVRSHPDKADVLLVDALIINEAEYEQPFPVIEMQFMDLDQKLVGSYRVEPSVYLDGELAGSDALMAMRTPVHIDIEIPDPGARAVNYQLQFR